MAGTAWFDGVDISLAIDMTHGALSLPTSLTGGFETRIRSLSLVRGRSSERDTFQVGTIVAILDNRDRVLDPEYTAGTYYGDLQPMRWARLSFTYSSTEYIQMYGYVHGFPQQWEKSDNDCTVALVIHDQQVLAGMALAPESAWAVGPSPGAAWYRLGEADGETICYDSRDLAGGYHGQYGSAAHTLTDSLIAYSTNGARQIVGGGLTDGSPLATGLRGMPAGTSQGLDMWVRFPADGYSSGGYVGLWSQSDAPFAYTDDGTSGTFPFPIFADTYFQVFIDTGTQRLRLAIRETFGAGAYEAYASIGALFDGGIHHITIERSSGVMSVRINGVSYGLTSTGVGSITSSSRDFGSKASVGPFHTATWSIDEIGVHAGAPGSTYWNTRYALGVIPGMSETVNERIDRIVDECNIAKLGTTLETSDVTCSPVDYGGGSNGVLAMLRQCEETEAGRLFWDRSGVLTFHARRHDRTTSVAAAFSDDPGSTLPYAAAVPEHDHSRVANYAAVQRVDGGSMVAEDTTSRGLYGRRTIGTSSALLYQSDAKSLEHAQALVATYKDPHPRIVSLTVRPRSAPTTLFPIVCSLDIGDKATFERAPLGGASFTYTLTIEGIQHRITAQGEWETTYLTAPADTVDWARWDIGDWDVAKWSW